eukprot:5486173-Amphidinium_carterae.1
MFDWLIRQRQQAPRALHHHASQQHNNSYKRAQHIQWSIAFKSRLATVSKVVKATVYLLSIIQAAQ